MAPTPSATSPAPDPAEPTPGPVEPTPTSPAEPTPEPTQEPTPSPTPTAPDEGETEEPSTPDAEPDARLAPNATIAATVPTQSRLTGSDRYAASVAVSKAAFPNGAGTVLIAAGDSPIGGILAASLAARLSAPLLYVQKSAVPSAVAAEISRLAPATILVVGGDKYVSAAVLDKLKPLAPDVRRYIGVDRYATSRMALLDRGEPAPTVYIAGGQGPLLTPPLAWVAAAATGRAALLVEGLDATPDAATLEALRAVGAQSLVIVGGTASTGTSYEAGLRAAGFTVTRRTGPDRYATAVVMASERPSPGVRAIVANDSSITDVALAAALAAATGQQLYYSQALCMPDGVAAHIKARGLPVTAVGKTSVLSASVLVGRSCTEERTLRQDRLASAIRSTLSIYNNGAGFSVAVRELGGLGQRVSIGGDVRREPASMIKLFAAWAALKKIQSGAATDATRLPSGVDLSTCLFVMIHVSDNYCHSDIVHWIGIAEINRMIRAAGFNNTTYGTVPYGTSVLYAGNRTTTNDLVSLLAKLKSGSILSRSASDRLIGLMKVQIFRTRIPSGIPPGVTQASKPGALWLTSGLLQADSAIIYSPAGTYLISIIGDQGPPQAALRAVSRTVYEHFNGAFGTAMTYPAQQMVTVRASALRTSPGGASAVVVPAGTPLQVNDANRTWYKVQWGPRELWTVLYDLKNR